jgi:Na+-transporting NADH:ubiquinone oxidoreductase subunit C
MSQPSVGYTIGFAAVLCLVCGVFVAGSAVALKDKQDANKRLDKQKKVLSVAGLIEEGASPSPQEVERLFADRIVAKAVDIEKGVYADSVDLQTFDQRKAAKDPATSVEAPDNGAKVARVPNHAVVYQVVDGGSVEQIILPIEGKGLWSTLYGFVSVETDMNTVKGLTFYEHAETPGLGGEVDNPKWKAGWQGRKIYNDDGVVELKVIKGKAKAPDKAPHKVDGLSGATLTSNGVSYTIEFWFGEDGFGPFIANVKSGKVNG